ncbi:MAG TPA: DUF4384 domain-containing protein [Burkholderiaceae bacterium]|nr:DUF4384 domain-containing protein [Burkholderiaceae bacterium]
MKRSAEFKRHRQLVLVAALLWSAATALANGEAPPAESNSAQTRADKRTDVSGRATQAAAPATPAVKNITSFTPALRCMDELFVAFQKRGIVITSGGLPDETAKVRTGTKEMLISAISRMSVRSGAFSFIDFHRTMGGQDDLGHLFEMKGAERTQMPDYYIRGSITQMDDNAIRKSKGFGFALPFMDFSLANDVAYDLLSMDMSVVEAGTRRIIPETSVANTMVITKGGRSADGGGKIGKAGIQLSMDFSRTEGLGAATRALIELSLIESLGKFTQVPYWKCLEIESGNPAMRETALEWYETANDKNRILFVQRKLAGMNRYRGDIDGKNSELLTKAVSEYQARVGLTANGQMSFELYFSLLDDTQNALAAMPVTSEPVLPSGIATAVRVAPSVDSIMEKQGAPTPGEGTLSIIMNSDRGSQPMYKVGETLKANITPSVSAVTYCYYEDASQNIVRIFPNKFTPNTILAAKQAHPIAQYGFKIKFDRPGMEKIGCVASDKIMRVPEVLAGFQDFQRIPNFTIDRVLLEYTKSNSETKTAVLRINITE